MIFTILGMPGAGKTTLGKNLADRFFARHVSAGDIAREMALVDEETRIALENGQVAPRRKMNDAMVKLLQDHRFEGAKAFLDGYPRYMEQLTDLFFATRGNFTAINLSVKETVAYARLSIRNRADDNWGLVQNRMMTFKNETVAVIDWLLNRHSRIVTIDGNKPENMVTEEAAQAIWRYV